MEVISVLNMSLDHGECTLENIKTFSADNRKKAEEYFRKCAEELKVDDVDYCLDAGSAQNESGEAVFITYTDFEE